MRNIIIIISLFSILLGCDNFKYDKYGKWAVAEDNFKGIDSLKLKGVVYDLKTGINGFHGRGILRLEIIESNIGNYDPRDKQANYYCIIKDGKAEVYDQIASHTKIGDTIYVDTNLKKIFIHNHGNFNKFKTTSIGPRQFFRRIQERGYQEF